MFRQPKWRPNSTLCAIHLQWRILAIQRALLELAPFRIAFQMQNYICMSRIFVDWFQFQFHFKYEKKKKKYSLPWTTAIWICVFVWCLPKSPLYWFPIPISGAGIAGKSGWVQSRRENERRKKKKTSKFDNVEAESVVTYVGFPLHLCKPIVVKCKRIHVWMRYILWVASWLADWRRGFMRQ